MKINNDEIKGIIFDLDGTLFDSCLVWKDVDSTFFKRRQMEVPDDYGKAISSMGLEAAAHYTKTRFNLLEHEPDIIKEWLNMVQDQYEHEVLLKKNAKEIVEKFYAEGLILGIATANSKACYLPCLVRNKIDQYFSHVYDVKEFIDGKNTPEFFLDVASKMNLKPQEILIFEDTLQALISAKNGHFHTCGVYESTCSCEDEELKKSISEFYTLDYHEFL